MSHASKVVSLALTVVISLAGVALAVDPSKVPSSATKQPPPAIQTPVVPHLPELSMLTGDGEVVSEPDGTATVNFTIAWYYPGKPGTCKANLGAHTGKDPWVYTKFEISPGSKFPMDVALKLPRPGAYEVVAYNAEFVTGGCKGKATKNLKVKPHPDFPCSLYPGFRKGPVGVMWICYPTSPAANVQPHQFGYLCEGGTKFANVSGYVFGCVTPGWLVTQ